MAGTSDGTDSPTAQALFEQEGLPFPPVPNRLAASLRQTPRSEFVFATRRLHDSPYSIDPFVQEAEASPQADYAVVGFDGHGVNSWAVHYYLVYEELALFIQQPWGGAYLDAERARVEIAERFHWAAGLQRALRQATRKGNIPHGWQLLVVATGLGHRSGWRWLAPARNGGNVAPWNPPDGTEAGLRHMLHAVTCGRTAVRA
jgi:hypothetical protein